MISKVVIFGTGAFTGAVGLVASVILVPPVKKAFSKGVSKFTMHLFETNDEFRAKMLEFAHHLIEEGQPNGT